MHPKGYPPGHSASTKLPLAEMQTPIATLDTGALQHNEDVFFSWAQAHGVQIAPHGKTTMSAALWSRLIARGVWGLTFATPWQVQVARSAGIGSIMLANPLVDPIAVAWVRAELDRDTSFRFACWADSVAAVDLAGRGSGPGSRPIDVFVDLGAPTGRTGARSPAEARIVADAVVAHPGLRLAGIAGWEGPFGTDRAAVATVDRYLQSVAALHRELIAARLYEVERPVLTAGGSMWPDRVADVLSPFRGEADIVLRSGCFQTHDDGLYRTSGPFGRVDGTAPLRAALHVWARVLSRPESALAILDAGRRDVGFDAGLPVPQQVLGHPGSDVLDDSVIDSLNDQHAFLRLRPGTRSDALPVGSVVRLGISHPCSVFDRWRRIPLIDDSSAEAPVVQDSIATWF